MTVAHGLLDLGANDTAGGVDPSCQEADVGKCLPEIGRIVVPDFEV